MAKSRKTKIALIGAKGYTQDSADLQVSCFAWSDLTKIINLRDYDKVIVSLLSLKHQHSTIDWDAFAKALDLRTLRDILWNGGSIIILGDPRFTIQRYKEGSSEPITEPFLIWTGMNFEWDGQPGDTIECVDDYEHRKYEEYLKSFKHWNYSLQKCELKAEKFFNVEYLKKEEISVELTQDIFCWNRYGAALAFSLRVALEKNRYWGYGYGADKEPIFSTGPLIILPEIDLTEDDTLVIVLRDLCGVESSLPEPAWLEEFNAPGQKAADDKLRQIQTQFDSLIEDYQKAQTEREKSRECLKLLYERGDKLELVVRNIFRGLGAHVEDPEHPGKEDGWLTVQLPGSTAEAVLEVKSTKNPQFGEDGIRQLLDWINRGVQLRQKKYKGIFIGNSSVDKALNERPWPFSDNWAKSAELHELAAITSGDLYVIYILSVSGHLEPEEFWQKLFSCNGVFDMTPYLAMLTPKEKKNS